MDKEEDMQEDDERDEPVMRRRALTYDENVVEAKLEAARIDETPAQMLKRGRICYMLGKSLLRVGDEKKAKDFLREATKCGVTSNFNSGLSSFFALDDSHVDFETAHADRDNNSYTGNTHIASSAGSGGLERNRVSSDGGHESEDVFFGLRKTRNFAVDLSKSVPEILATFGGIKEKDASVLTDELGSSSLLGEESIGNATGQGLDRMVTSTLENILAKEAGDDEDSAKGRDVPPL
jgi:hypothetical protein